MEKKLLVFILITSSLLSFAYAQAETYAIKKVPFCSDDFNEFSPSYYQNGIVFCSNRISNFSRYSSSEGEGHYKIYFADTSMMHSGPKSKLFSKDLTSKLNDGPVTFNRFLDTIYFSRNLHVNESMKNLSGSRNKLGLFYAVRAGKKWTSIREIRFNNEWHNLTTPCLSSDGSKLFFASDKPDGFGGSDLYYSQWKNNYWESPVNLGPAINTGGNEAYPFVNESGELFFSSDGHPGLGGKDIFFSKYVDSEWLPPIHLDSPINSAHDDFGIIINPSMNEGYFTSNRDKSYDIFRFKTNFNEIYYTHTQQENEYCFRFNDEGTIEIDTSILQYRWDFSNGGLEAGSEVSHCFLDPGSYVVRLDIVQKGTGAIYFTKLLYNLDLQFYEQPYINCVNMAVKGDTIVFDGLRSYLPGCKTISFSWDFGDGSRSFGETVKHAFPEKGEYTVKLGVKLKVESTGKVQNIGVSRKVSVFNDQKEFEALLTKMIKIPPDLNNIKNYENALIRTLYSAETEYQKNGVFTLEVLSSKKEIPTNSKVFKKLPNKYKLKKNYIPEEGSYSYTVDQHHQIMSLYPAYTEMQQLGYNSARVRLKTLTDPAEIELDNIIRVYGCSTDIYFDKSDRLTPEAYIMLDQIVKIMNKYPTLKLEVAVHADNIGSTQNNLVSTQRKSKILTGYMINRGVSQDRLYAAGYGASKPIASNLQESGRRLNRRIDFIIAGQ